MASALPWMMTNWFGVKSGGEGIPQSVRLSFYIGAAAFLGAVLCTVFKTREYPPGEQALAEIKNRKFDWTLGLGDIAGLIFRLPRRMWELGAVQFFTWIAMFSLWVYFSPAVARNIFHAAPNSPEMEAAGAWAGFCFAGYNVVCFVFSFGLLWAVRIIGPKWMHILCLGIGAAGLAAMPLWHEQLQLLISMAAIGVAWASILSMPYAMLAPALPKDQVGVMMGMFNLFIVLPQILASSLLGWALKAFLHNDPVNVLVLGGASMGLAAFLTLILVGYQKQPASDAVAAPAGAGAH